MPNFIFPNLFCNLWINRKCLNSDYIKKTKIIESRSFSNHNVTNFKNSLGALSWESTIQCTDVNESYAQFYEDFMFLFELNFPKTKKQFNKNHHKINGFMTAGLLTSRTTKNLLHKKSITDPSEN
jgi:hypothetical protein